MSQPGTFQCPHCGMVLRLPAGPPPPGGIAGSCPGCKKAIRWSGPPPDPSPADTRQPKPTATPSHEFAVQGPDGSVKKLSRVEVEERIRAGTILAWDLISERDQQASVPACELESFQGLFDTRDAIVRTHCWDHGGRLASMVCRRCGRGFCPSCVPRPERAGLTLRVCPACEGVLDPADPRTREQPFWRRLDEVFLYPLRDFSWVTTLLVGFFFGLASSGFGIIRPRAFLVLPICLAFVVYALSRSAKGDKKMGIGPDISDPLELAGMGLTAIIVTVVVLLPGVLFHIFLLSRGVTEPGPLALLYLPFILFAIAYYPMALGMSAVWHNRWMALRPDVVIGYALKIKDDYVKLLIFCVAISAVQGLIQVAGESVPILGGIAGGVVSMYFGFVEAHAIGWTFYMNGDVLELS